MIKYFLQNEEWSLQRATDGASGYDLRAALGVSREINPGERWLISTGLHLQMPRGVEAQVRSRSGLAINHGVVVLNAPGTIDSDYRGEIKVSLINLDRSASYAIQPGERIAQLVIAPVFCASVDPWLVCGAQVHVEMYRVSSLAELDATDRGEGGHGSTGR